MAAVEAQRVMTLSLGKIVASRNRRGGISLHRNLLVASVLFRARDAYLKEHSTSTNSPSAKVTKVRPITAEPTSTDRAIDNSEMDSDQSLSSTIDEQSSSRACTPTDRITSTVNTDMDEASSNSEQMVSTTSQWNSEQDTEKENTPPAIESVGACTNSDSEKRHGLPPSSPRSCRKRSHAAEVDSSSTSLPVVDSDKCSPAKTSKLEVSDSSTTVLEEVSQSSRNCGNSCSTSDVSSPVQSCHEHESSTTTTTKFRDNIFSTAYQTSSYTSAASKNISCSNLLDSLPMPMLVMQVV